MSIKSVLDRFEAFVLQDNRIENFFPEDYALNKLQAHQAILAEVEKIVDDSLCVSMKLKLNAREKYVWLTAREEILADIKAKLKEER